MRRTFVSVRERIFNFSSYACAITDLLSNKVVELSRGRNPNSSLLTLAIYDINERDNDTWVVMDGVANSSTRSFYV